MRVLVGLASTPDGHGNLERCIEGLTQVGTALGFDLLVGERTLAERSDAEAVARQFADRGVDLVLLLCNSFTPNGDVVLPLAALPSRLGLWALPEPDRQGRLELTSLVDLNLFASMVHHFGCGPQPRCKWFYGQVGDPAFQRRLEVTVRALRVIKGLRGAAIGYIGGHAPGFENLVFDEQALQHNLGVQVEALPLDVVLDAARACGEAEAAALGERLSARASQVTCARGDLTATARIALALERVCDERGFSALAVSCWPGFYQALGVFPCVAYGTVNAGGRVVSCEGDVMGAVSLMALALASDVQPTMADMVTFLPGEDAVCFWHCGLATWNLADSGGVRLITRPVPQPEGGEAPVGGFADVTFASAPATIARLHRDGSQLLVVGAEATDRLGSGYEGSSGWFVGLQMAHQSITPFQLLDAVVREGIEHHYAIALQDVTDACTEFARWLGVHVVEPGSDCDHV
jgi:L-fucose isomerase-like protein